MKSDRREKLSFSALCMGFFMVILDVTIVNVTLPTMADYFHTKLSGLQWVVDGYTLTFAGLLLLVGSLSDIFGAKKIFQLGSFLLKINSIGDLANACPNELYTRLKEITGQSHDPFVWDIFAAAINEALTGKKQSWWEWTKNRKKRYLEGTFQN